MPKAIVVVSFGVGTAAKKEQYFTPLLNEVKAAFPSFSVYEAWTSRILSERLGVSMLDDVLKEVGGEAILLLTHFSQGAEYQQKILPILREYPKIKLTLPILYVEQVIEHIFQSYDLEDGEHLVLVGHGSKNQHNTIYEELQKKADKLGLPLHIGVLEESDYPNRQMVVERLQKQKVNKVLLAPLLYVGGRHASYDIVGGIWEETLRTSGVELRTDAEGLGSKKEFRALYIKEVKRLLSSSE